MSLEYYTIIVDPISRNGELEFRYGSRIEKQLIKDFKLMEKREIMYHSTEGDVIDVEQGPTIVSLSMMRADLGE